MQACLDFDQYFILESVQMKTEKNFLALVRQHHIHCFCVVVVVQTLAHNSTATLSVIKDYLINKLQRESQQIEDDERKICQYREETAHLRSEIQELKTRLVI